MRFEESDCSVKWEQRLRCYKDLVLFFWKALSFEQYAIAGVAMWFLVNLTLRLLLSQEESVVYIIGNFFLLSSLAVVLCHLAASYSSITFLNDWAEEHEIKFKGICAKIAEVEVSLRILCKMGVQLRRIYPVKFYVCGAVGATIIVSIDCIVSLSVVLQLIACLLLLLPVLLQRRFLKRLSEKEVSSSITKMQDILYHWTMKIIAQFKTLAAYLLVYKVQQNST